MMRHAFRLAPKAMSNRWAPIRLEPSWNPLGTHLELRVPVDILPILGVHPRKRGLRQGLSLDYAKTVCGSRRTSHPQDSRERS